MSEFHLLQPPSLASTGAEIRLFFKRAPRWYGSHEPSEQWPVAISARSTAFPPERNAEGGASFGHGPISMAYTSAGANEKS